MTHLARRRSRYMIAAVFLLLIACAASGLWLNQQKAQAERWVRHTFEVSDSLSRVRILNLRAEVFRRGYLLTGDAKSRASIQGLRQALPAELDGLRANTEDNPAQAVRVIHLRTLLQKRLADY